MDAYHHLTGETAGNGVTTARTYWPNSGRTEQIEAEIPGQPPQTVESLSYTWDTIGNLLARDDAYNTVAENFCYNDGANGANVLNRLSQYSVGGSDCSSGSIVKTMSYDNDGDIAAKSDVGSYTYSGNGAGPHAVTSIATNSGVMVDGISNPDFVYDGDGNMLCVSNTASCVTGNGRNYSYTSFNMVDSVSQGSNTTTIAYDPEHMRGSSTTSSGVTTWYFGNRAVGLWTEMVQGSTNTWHDYLRPYGEIVAELFNTGGTVSVDYFVGDHLASTTAVTNAAPALQEYDSYDAWGQRRQTDGNDAPNCGAIAPHPPVSLRGYTGQEELYAYCLVNLNGRIYDPALGRFLSPDPRPPHGLSGQSYGVYSYVVNRPLVRVDPTGYDEITNPYDILPIDGSNGCTLTCDQLVEWDAVSGSGQSNAGGSNSTADDDTDPPLGTVDLGSGWGDDQATDGDESGADNNNDSSEPSSDEQWAEDTSLLLAWGATNAIIGTGAGTFIWAFFYPTSAW
jgi:RHS repeat-associated protein